MVKLYEKQKKIKIIRKKLNEHKYSIIFSKFGLGV